MYRYAICTYIRIHTLVSWNILNTTHSFEPAFHKDLHCTASWSCVEDVCTYFMETVTVFLKTSGCDSASCCWMLLVACPWHPPVLTSTQEVVYVCPPSRSSFSSVGLYPFFLQARFPYKDMFGLILYIYSTYIYICIYTCIYSTLCIYIYIYRYKYIYIYIYLSICLPIYLFVSIYPSIYLSIYMLDDDDDDDIYIYVYIHTYIHTYPCVASWQVTSRTHWFWLLFLVKCSLITNFPLFYLVQSAVDKIYQPLRDCSSYPRFRRSLLEHLIPRVHVGAVDAGPRPRGRSRIVQRGIKEPNLLLNSRGRQILAEMKRTKLLIIVKILEETYDDPFWKMRTPTKFAPKKQKKDDPDLGKLWKLLRSLVFWGWFYQFDAGCWSVGWLHFVTNLGVVPLICQLGIYQSRYSYG